MSRVLRVPRVHQAFKELPVLVVNPDRKDDPELQATQAPRDLAVNVDLLARLGPRAFLDDPVIKVIADPQVLLEKQDSRVFPDPQDKLATTAAQAQLVLLVLLVRLEPLEKGVSVDSPEKADSRACVVPPEREDPQDPLVNQDRLDLPDPLEHVVTPVPRVTLAWVEREVFLVAPAHEVHLDLPAPAVGTERWAPQVRAANLDPQVLSDSRVSSRLRETEVHLDLAVSPDPRDKPADQDPQEPRDRRVAKACPAHLVKLVSEERTVHKDKGEIMDLADSQVNKEQQVNLADQEPTVLRESRATPDFRDLLASLEHRVLPDLRV